MTDSPKPFAYSAAQWREIVGTIPAAKAADSGLMFTVRYELEAAASGYLVMNHRHRTRFAKGSSAKQTLQAHDQIKAALNHAEETGNAALRDSLAKALKTMSATTQVEALDMLRRSRKGRTDPVRDLFHHRALKVWTDTLAGELTTGRKSNASSKREANSPAIRFFLAALKPLAEIGPEAAKKIVEAERAGRGVRNIVAKKKNALRVVV